MGGGGGERREVGVMGGMAHFIKSAQFWTQNTDTCLDKHKQQTIKQMNKRAKQPPPPPKKTNKQKQKQKKQNKQTNKQTKKT